ncbi:MAG TPA: hypothetical protein VF407_23765 [Polyangiaceae bacterium]
MIRRPRAVLFATLFSLAACNVYTNDMQSFRDRGVPRASYELQCPKEQLEITDLGNGTMGVRGCGKQAVYKEVSGAGWVNDSETINKAP